MPKPMPIDGTVMLLILFDYVNFVTKLRLFEIVLDSARGLCKSVKYWWHFDRNQC